MELSSELVFRSRISAYNRTQKVTSRCHVEPDRRSATTPSVRLTRSAGSRRCSGSKRSSFLQSTVSSKPDGGESRQSRASKTTVRPPSSSRSRRRTGQVAAVLADTNDAVLDLPKQTAVTKFAQHIESDNGLVLTTVDYQGESISVRINVEMRTRFGHTERPLQLHWGIHRTSRESWYILEPSEVPAGTTFISAETEAMRTPIELLPDGTHRVELTIDAELAPFSLDFVLFQPPLETGERERWLRNGRKLNFCVPIGMGQGSPQPLGATLKPSGGVNFAVFSRHAEGVTLCLYEEGDAEPSLEIDLEPSMHRTGDVWHVELSEREASRFSKYGYRCRGDIDWEDGHRFNPRIVLLDPYAKIIADPSPGQEELPSPAAALGRIPRADDALFDWENDFHPRIPLEELVAYRLNVSAFTSDASSGVSSFGRGTFLGVIERADHLLNLGVNAVILQPVAAFDETQGSYYPLSFFAALPSYGREPSGEAASFDLKAMVRELHSCGIEVFLEVVFSHTAEMSDAEPKPISLRGIDNATYFRTDDTGAQLVPEFGAQNAIDSSNPIVQKMIIDSLRHWVKEYHVDGFVFINAAELLRGLDGLMSDRPPLVEAIAFDPILAGSKLIADLCSPITGACMMVDFPHWGRWAQLNSQFRDDVRSFIKGDGGKVGALATRIYGSGHLFSEGRGPCFGFNSVTSFRGLTLADLVSYTVASESSWDCGGEGRSEDPMVSLTRLRQMRNLLLALFASQGVPVLTMGDECGASKNGSTALSDRNDAFDWALLDSDLGRQIVRFISSLALFRQRRRPLLQRRFFFGAGDLDWHGTAVGAPEWDNPGPSILAFSIHSAGIELTLDPASKRELDLSLGDLYVAFNSQPNGVTVQLPPPPLGMSWLRLVDTALFYPDDIELHEPLPLDEQSLANPTTIIGTYGMQPYSAILLEARTTPTSRM